jgi:hypothetical protein
LVQWLVDVQQPLPAHMFTRFGQFGELPVQWAAKKQFAGSAGLQTVLLDANVVMQLAPSHV